MLDLSVLVTCYNKEDFLDECISSIVRQTKSAKEIIVVHDGCDNPMAHAEATTIILNKNQGVAKARHEAFRFSTGSLILFVDGDDMIDPDYLEKMVLTIAKGKADVAFPDVFLWAQNSRLVVLPKKIDASFVKFTGKVVIPVTCLMKREVYESLDGFREWTVLEDLDFWMRALCNNYTFKKAETLLWYRRVEGTRNQADESLRKEVFNKIMGQFVITKDKITYAEK